MMRLPQLALASMLLTLLLSPLPTRADEAPGSTTSLTHAPAAALLPTQVAAAPARKGEEHVGHDHEGKPAAAEPPASAAVVTRGRQLFAQNCAGCHGASAEGKAGPKLVGTSHSAAEIRQFVTRGIAPKMPAFAGKLSAEQIASVAAYVKSLGPAGGAGHVHEHGAQGKPGVMAGHKHEHSAAIGMSRIAGREMSRDGSGTAWLPESSPMWARHSTVGKWALMQHGNLVVMYDAQGGPRGVSRPVASNWYMVMGNRPLGKGELMLRTMLSLEPATFGNNGQPQLFQTGEGLIDRQHPHDLFMEIAAQYSHPLNDRLSAYLYLAPVGEPALGPVAFMHRPSAMEIPTAPLIHHWTDSTHISYGVITAGIQSRQWKLEGSWFNGHEPDGKRWAIDPLALNSYSGRLSYSPNQNWAFQLSHGRIDNPEIHYPGEHQGDVNRTTFSASYNRPLRDGNWATTFAWGRNHRSDSHSDGFLLESNYNWAERNYLFGRIERADKDELFPGSDPRSEQQFLVNSFSLGYARDIGRSKSFETALGAMATVYAKSNALDRTYGEFPVGVQVFLRIRPRRTQGMHGAAGEHRMPGGGGHKEQNGMPGHSHGSGALTPSSPLLSALLARELAMATGKLSPR